MMNWLKFSENKESVLTSGSLLKFSASYPFEEEVVMMVCYAPMTTSKFGLMTITGYKAGFNCYSVFPDQAYLDGGILNTEMLYNNWQDWVWPEGSPDEVWILPEGLSASDLA